MRPIDDFYQALGARIRVLREGKHTQQELAERVGLSRTSITNIERGTQRLMADQLVAVARALGTSVEELFIGAAIESPSERSSLNKAEMPTVARFVEKALADTEA